MASESHRSSTSPPQAPLPPRKRRRRSPSPTKPPPSPSRSLSRSPSRSGDDGRKRRRTDLAVDVCKEFMRDLCHRSEIDCKFAHPHSTVTIGNDKVTACADALRGKCFRGRTCRYYHPTPHIQEPLLKAIGVPEPKVEQICRDFLRGRCLRAAKECRFVHHSSIDDSAVVCQDFLRGRCDRNSCRYLHGQVSTTSQVCQDFLRGRCDRRSCRYIHEQVHVAPQIAVPLLPYGALLRIPSPPRAGNDKEILEVCKDFLKNKCNRDECRFAHPNSKVEVFNNTVEVCRDFRRGVCHRSVCRFYHP